MKGGHNFKDETGKKYGRLSVLKRNGYKSHSVGWLCSCDCGNIITTSGTRLRRGQLSCGCTQKLPKGQGAFNCYIRRTKIAAKARGYKWEIEDSFVAKIGQFPCHYCGTAPAQKITKIGPRKCNGEYVYNGIDRLDNNKGYVPSNCVPCCGTCNRAKFTMSESEFLDWIHRVHHYRELKCG